ncbi:GIY-YIG nuclease family protein [Nitrosomonas sp.]|uniref:GIY-YIG nuclease family protein n=1 Tax=Nitrosomonas sp. TaxID=42353 RepID=UPI001DDC386C|nr:GIY-YIG nuclease family protein [Nitrosomonas sp.]MBX9637663.1 GIY-YIG nuclease family protein [Nitrosomonas sp.]MBY0483848.1 GIY-YIG nuclease family protein [Nitrosomonas sp.]
MEKQAAVYILASQYNGTLYIGVTSNLIQRVWQRFNARSSLKSWNRQWKINLIEKMNPTWKDLWPDLV